MLGRGLAGPRARRDRRRAGGLRRCGRAARPGRVRDRGRGWALRHLRHVGRFRGHRPRARAAPAGARGLPVGRRSTRSGHGARAAHGALALTARGRLRPVIGATYPLTQAAKAHRALEERTTLGKSLLLV
ncbi:zinc-binding dehydrogenase [Lentzea chajnantorensis]